MIYKSRGKHLLLISTATFSITMTGSNNGPSNEAAEAMHDAGRNATEGVHDASAAEIGGMHDAT